MAQHIQLNKVVTLNELSGSDPHHTHALQLLVIANTLLVLKACESFSQNNFGMLHLQKSEKLFQMLGPDKSK